MHWKSLFLALTIGVVVGQACTRRAPSNHPVHKCAAWDSLDEESRRSFALASCVELAPQDWDLDSSVRETRPEQCTVRGVVLTGRLEPDDILDSFAELSSPDNPDSPITLRPTPRVNQKMPGAGAGAPLACDRELARVYLGSPFLGYIVAYRLDGRELWRMSLPGFQTVIGRPIDDSSPRGLVKLQESEGSICCRMALTGSDLAIAYRNKGLWHQTIVHRSGVAVAAIGAWDGVLAGATKDGWVFGAGGMAAHGTWKLPVEQLSLRLTAAGPDPLIEHFLAWNLPRPQDTHWVWRKCDADNAFARLQLGARFDPKLDELARTIHDGLGPDWARKMFEDDAMTPVLFRQDLSFDDWKARVRTALLDAGADVDCMNYVREHNLELLPQYPSPSAAATAFPRCMRNTIVK
jgi:hypothetical protein